MQNLCEGAVILVTGGASSGKSALAERICCARGGRLLYIATMRPHGPEAAQRIARHRAARSGKGFETVECDRDLHAFRPDGRYDAALVEDLDNLLANQMFGAGAPPDNPADLILEGISALTARTGLLVAVAGEIFSGAERYEGGTDAYLRAMGEIRRRLARSAAVVVESVCGLPLVQKGELEL